MKVHATNWPAKAPFFRASEIQQRNSLLGVVTFGAPSCGKGISVVVFLPWLARFGAMSRKA